MHGVHAPRRTFFLRVMPGSSSVSSCGRVLIVNSDAALPPCFLSVLAAGMFFALSSDAGPCVFVGEPTPLGWARLGSHTGDSAAGGSSLDLVCGPPS